LLVVPRPADWDWTAAVLEVLATPKLSSELAVVTLPQVHWQDGTTFDLVTIGHRCRELGIPLVVDGTQSIGARVLDVQAVQPAFLACSAYKWLLCPYGLAFLYVAPDRQEGGKPIEMHNWERTGDGFCKCYGHRQLYFHLTQ
jgi:selenocysteine lyase/cysteine desulfurase